MRLDALPDGMVAHCRAGLDADEASARLTVHFELPGDEISYESEVDRLRLAPDVGSPASTSQPDTSVVEFAERAVERITKCADVSWPREGSCVWRARSTRGGTWSLASIEHCAADSSGPVACPE